MTAEPLPRASSPEERGEDQRSLAALLSALHDLGEASPEFRVAVSRILAAHQSEPGRLRLVGKAHKVSVSMPEDLTAAVRQRVGHGDFSQYVTEAVARRLELDLLGELAAMLEAEHGPVPDDALTEARRAWPDAQ